MYSNISPPAPLVPPALQYGIACEKRKERKSRERTCVIELIYTHNSVGQGRKRNNHQNSHKSKQGNYNGVKACMKLQLQRYQGKY